MKISKTGVALIQEFEGLELESYQDSVGIWTIGYGTTRNIHEGMVITEGQATQFLEKDVSETEQAVNNMTSYPINQNQFDALVSFAYNVGITALRSSTLMRKLNAGDVDGAANEFQRWVRAGGKVLPGLVRRREAERALFIS